MSTAVKNTRGNTVLTVSDRSADITTPLTMVGQNYSGYGSILFGDLYALMENFADSTAPASPAEGMLWYDTSKTNLNYWDTSAWITVLGSGNSMSAQLPMDSTSLNIDLTSTGSTTLHTVSTGTVSMVSGILLVPRTGASATGNIIAGLEITADSNDIMDQILIDSFTSDAQFAYFNVSGVNRIGVAADAIKLRVSQAAAGTLAIDAYLFGMVRGAL